MIVSWQFSLRARGACLRLIPRLGGVPGKDLSQIQFLRRVLSRNFSSSKANLLERSNSATLIQVSGASQQVFSFTRLLTAQIGNAYRQVVGTFHKRIAGMTGPGLRNRKGVWLIVGLIGAGRIGGNHASVLQKTEGVDQLLIADSVSDRADTLADAFPNAKAETLDGLFHDSDAVIIASSTDTHAGLLIRAAEASITTFCEKPISLDLASTESAVAAVDEAGINVQMGFQRRYDPAMRAIHDRLASGEIGVPYLVRSQTHDPEPPPLDYIPVSGGIFKDCLIHDIDVVRFVTGQEVVAVQANGSYIGHPAIAELGDFGSATAVLEMSAGTIAQLSGLRADPNGYDVRLEVFAPGATLAAGWSDRTPIESTEPGAGRPDDPIVTFWDRFDAAYHAEMEAFVQVILGAEEPASNHHDAYADLVIAEACDISAAEGRRVLIEEVA